MSDKKYGYKITTSLDLTPEEMIALKTFSKDGICFVPDGREQCASLIELGLVSIVDHLVVLTGIGRAVRDGIESDLLALSKKHAHAGN